MTNNAPYSPSWTWSHAVGLVAFLAVVGPAILAHTLASSMRDVLLGR